MNPDKQRIAIAEACGWRLESVTPTLWRIMHGDKLDSTFQWNDFKGKIGPPTLKDVASSLPDYLNDLNAMHEAEHWLINHDPEWILWLRYERLLQEGSKVPSWHANAAQRAEAFLRTIAKWEEEP